MYYTTPMKVQKNTDQAQPTRRRTQAERREQGKKALLKSAAELFAEQGINQTSLMQIGERAGYSRGLVNHHFGSKDELIDQLARYTQENFWAAFDTISVETGYGGVTATFDTFYGQIVPPTSFGRAFMVMWGGALPIKSAKTVVREMDDRSRTMLADWIRTGHADGTIPADVSAEATAITLLAMLRGLAAQLQISPELAKTRDLYAQYRRAVSAVLGR